MTSNPRSQQLNPSRPLARSKNVLSPFELTGNSGIEARRVKGHPRQLSAIAGSIKDVEGYSIQIGSSNINPYNG